MAQDVGTNITIIDKDDCFYIKVLKDAKMTASASGRSKILASSGGFVTIEVKGKKFADKDIGINVVVTVRDAKAKKKRDDDDDAEEKPVSNKKKRNNDED